MSTWPAQYHRSPKVARYCGKAKQYTIPDYHPLGGSFYIIPTGGIPSRDGFLLGLPFSYHNYPLNRI